jgi:Domain of Unknown Function (DUF1080)
MPATPRSYIGLWIVVLVMLTAARSEAGLLDNQLTDQEKKDGWILLFDGKSDQGWMTSGWEACPEVVDQGAINPSKCPKLGAGGWDMVYEQPWTNFALELDFKISPNTNSGVMVRIWPLRALPGFDVEYNGLEVQILDSKTAGYYDTGAIYDLVKPTTNAMRPVGEWNHLRISCDKSLLEVWVNGTHVNRMNLDDWTQPFERPDGTEHKFNIAWKYHSHIGYIGLQKHGGNCWFKNIKLKPLD